MPGKHPEKYSRWNQNRRKEQKPMRPETIRALFANGAKYFYAHAEIAGI